MTKTLPATPVQVCPHLGVEEDLQTCLAYPSSWNLCHKCRPAAAIRLSHQRKMCLAPGHTGCPVFQGQEGLALPMELRARQGKAARAASGGR